MASLQLISVLFYIHNTHSHSLFFCLSDPFTVTPGQASLPKYEPFGRCCDSTS